MTMLEGRLRNEYGGRLESFEVSDQEQHQIVGSAQKVGWNWISKVDVPTRIYRKFSMIHLPLASIEKEIL